MTGEMIRRPAAVLIGTAGAVLGLAALLLDHPLLGLLAGVCALAAGIAAAARPSPVATAQPETPAVPCAEPSSASSAPVAAAVPLVHGADGSFVDARTGLFNEAYFRIAVETRITAARRQLRPVAVVLFEVQQGSGADARPADPAAVASIVQRTLRDADTACRLDDGRIGLVLEDTPEDGAIWAVERLRRGLNAAIAGGLAQIRWAGIACYPAHAFDAKEALDKAQRAFDSAREWKQDRIEVASVD